MANHPPEFNTCLLIALNKNQAKESSTSFLYSMDLNKTYLLLANDEEEGVFITKEPMLKAEIEDIFFGYKVIPFLGNVLSQCAYLKATSNNWIEHGQVSAKLFESPLLKKILRGGQKAIQQATTKIEEEKKNIETSNKIIKIVYELEDFLNEGPRFDLNFNSSIEEDDDNDNEQN